MYSIPFIFFSGRPVGYKIQFWVKEKGESTMEEQDFPFEGSAESDQVEGSVTLLKPYSNMVLQVEPLF